MFDPISAGVAIGGAVIGGLFNNKSTRDTNEKNLEAVRETNAANALENDKNRTFASKQTKGTQVYNSREAEKAYQRSVMSVESARTFDVKQIKDARVYNERQIEDQRAFDVAQVADQREYDKTQVLAAEARTRDYLEQDRQYASPAAQRARLEAAGINPLLGMDASSALGGSTGMAATQRSIATSGIATSSIASSGIANASAAQMGVSLPSGSIPMVSPTFMASRPGDAIMAAGQAYIDINAAEQDMALRRSQLQLEHDRLSQTINRASMAPIIDGPYQDARSLSRSPVNPNSVGPAASIYGDTREVRVEPLLDVPALADIELPSGRKVAALNPDLDLEGISGQINSARVGALIAGDVILNRQEDYTNPQNPYRNGDSDDTFRNIARIPAAPMASTGRLLDSDGVLRPYDLQTAPLDRYLGRTTNPHTR